MVNDISRIGLWVVFFALIPFAATAQLVGEPDLTPVGSPERVLDLRGELGAFTDTNCNTEAGDGDEIGCWADQSGKGNDATAASLTGPDLATGVSGLNAQDAFLFDRTTNSNTGEGLGPADTDDINTAMGGYAERTITLAIRTPGDVNTNRQVIYEEGDASHGFNVYLDGSGALKAAAWSDNWTGDHFSVSTSVSANTSYVVTFVFDDDGANNLELFVDGSASGTASDASIGTMPTHNGDIGIGNVVGGTQFGASTEVTGDGNEGFDGHVAELQLFNDAVGSAPRQILESALGERYGVSITNDRYTHGGYPNDVTGLGQASDGTQQTTDTTGVLFFDATSLSGGDFALFGHNGNAESFSADTDPEDVSERLDRVWRLDQTGSPSFDLKFDVSSFSLGSGEKYQVLVDSDASFSSGASVVGGTVEGDTLTVADGDLSGLSDGDYVTLAIANTPNTPQNLTATASGSQKVTLNWDAVSQNTNGDATTIDKYRIYRNTSAGPEDQGNRGNGFSEATLIDSTGMTSFDATGLTSGTQYFFFVVAVNGIGASAEQAKPSGATPAPFGATGPGGVGATDGTGRLKVWLRGDQGLSTSGGGDVTQWNDQSGYGHNFVTGTSPSSTTLNGKTAVSFDGSSEYLKSNSAFTTADTGPPDDLPETNYTQFVVLNTTDSYGSVLAVTESPVTPDASGHDRQFGPSGGDLTSRIWDEETISGGTIDDGNTHVGGLRVELGSGQFLSVDGSTTSGTKDKSQFDFEQGIVLGGHTRAGSFDTPSNPGYLDGTVAEVILYNASLNDAETTIIQNYLATKYGASLAPSVDKYAYDGTYGNDLAGIGRATSSDSTHLASATSILEVSTTSFAGDDRYVFLGHDGGTVSSFGYESTEPINGRSANAERMEREWRADLSGTSSKTVTVSISGGDLPSKQAGYEYVLIVDSGEKFNTSPRAYTLKDGGGGSCEQADATCSVSNVSLDDGDHVTVGAGKRVINFKNTTAQSFETAGDVTVTAEINLPYPSSGSDVSLAFTNKEDLDNSGIFEDAGTDQNPNSNTNPSGASPPGSNSNGDFEADGPGTADGGDDNGDSNEGSINGDYKVKSSSTSPVTLSAGTGSTTITLTLDNDGLEEQSEKFRVVVDGGNTTNAGAGADDKITYTILDDDEPREIKFADPDYTDGTNSDPNGSPSSTEGTTGGFREETFTVSIRQDGGGETATSSTPCTSVGFAVDDNSTATAGTADLNKSTNSTVDFKIKNGTDPGGTCPEYQTRSSATEGRLYFGGNNAEAKLTLKINEDDADDPDPETIMLNLSNPISSGLVNTSSPDSTTMTFQLNDDDSAPNVLFSSSSSNGDESANGSISVTLDNVSAKEVTVDFAVNSSSTAQQPGDFSSLSPSSPKTLTYPADQEVDSKTITFNVSDDSQNELDETVVLDLSSPSNATLGGRTTHTYTINDNDPALVGASGPGGVGATDGTGKLNIWLEGDSVTTSGAEVTAWRDQSGYGHDFTHQGSSTEKPSVTTINGKKVLTFATEDWLGSTSTLTTDNNNSLAAGPDDIPETDYTQFLVFKTTSNGDAVTVVNPVGPSVGNNDRNFGIQGGKLANRIWDTEIISSGSNFNDGTVHVGAIQVEKGAGQFLYADGTQVASGTLGESDFDFEQGIVIGRYDGQFGQYSGEIGEFALFDRVLNDTRRTLIQNHLAAKYGASLTSGDVYAGDQSMNGDYDDGVFGVGRESTDDFHAKAGRDGLNLSNVSGFDQNGDYLTLGHRTNVNGVNTSDVDGASSVGARWNRTWYTDLSNNAGDPISVEVTFDLSEAGLTGSAGTASNYKLLQRPADPTTSADSSWTIVSTASTKNNDTITFTGVSALQNDTEITLGTTDESASPLGGQPTIVLRGTEGNEQSWPNQGSDNGFVMLGPPEGGGTFEGLATDTDPQAIEFNNLASPMAYEYDAANDNWVAVPASNSDNAIPSGEGFLFWVWDNTDHPDADPVDPTLPITVSDGNGVPSSDVTRSGLGKGDQWVFLANPYGVPFNLESITASGNSQDINAYNTTVQTWDRIDETWDPGLTLDTGADGGDDKRVGVGQGFFLECTNYQSTNCPTQVTLPTSGKMSGSREVIGLSKGDDAPEIPDRLASLRLSMQVEQGGKTVANDRAARVLFYEKATDGWDRYDATKLTPFLRNYATLAPLTPAGDTTRAAAQASRPWPAGEDTVEVPLAVTTAGVSGTATVRPDTLFQVPDGWDLTLVDTKGTPDPADDEETAWTDGASYTFELSEAKAATAGAAVQAADEEGEPSRGWEPGPLELEETEAWQRSGPSGRAAAVSAAGHDSTTTTADSTGRDGAESGGTETSKSGTAKSAKADAPAGRLVLRVEPNSTEGAPGDSDDEAAGNENDTEEAAPIEKATVTAEVKGTSVQLSWDIDGSPESSEWTVQHQRLPPNDTTADPEPDDWAQKKTLNPVQKAKSSKSPSVRLERLDYGRHAFRLTKGKATSEVAEAEVRLEESYEVIPPYPNPARQQATLEVAVREEQRVTVRVYDMLGRHVRTMHSGGLPAQNTETMRISTGRMASGKYFLRVKGEEFSTVESFTVVR